MNTDVTLRSVDPSVLSALKPRQRKFIELKIASEFRLSSAKCARAAGYAESTARKANRDVVGASPMVAWILAKAWEELRGSRRRRGRS